MKRIQKGDKVLVTTGKSKGHVGEVTWVKDEKVIVEGANLITKTIKANKERGVEGGFTTREAPLDVSNVAIYNPILEKADKVGFKYIDRDGKKQKVRYFKSNNEVIV